MSTASLGFAAIGLDHVHILHQIRLLQDAGASFCLFHTEDDAQAKIVTDLFPDARRAESAARILEDPSIRIVTGAGIPDTRAGTAVEAMRHGKDVLMDKPGATDLGQLAVLRRTQRETGRIYAVAYLERFVRRSVIRAMELVRSGAVGDVVHVTGFGPHREGSGRPDWFYSRARSGGILTDIGAHQAEQFLSFAGDHNAHVVSALVANRAHPQHPDFQDMGEMLLRNDHATGHSRLDWFTPEGLGAWGDVRLFVTGTQGFIEARKVVDLTSDVGERLLLVDGTGVRDIPIRDVPVSMGRDFCADVLNRTETLMPQEQCFRAMELALSAQSMADLAQPWRKRS